MTASLSDSKDGAKLLQLCWRINSVTSEATGKADFPFDDVRKALTFALNAHDPRMPSPVMNREMAKVPVKVPKKRLKAIADAWAAVGVEDLIDRVTTRTPGLQAPNWWQGLPEPAQAGFVLQELNKLDAQHRVVLQGLLIKSHSPCTCRRPCCCGWTVDFRWQAAVDETCRLLADTVDVMKTKGKKGLSSQPQLRRLAVEQYFTGKPLTLTDLARVTDISMVTAAKHRELIHAWLFQTEGEAWPEISAMLEAAGIVGTNLLAAADEPVRTGAVRKAPVSFGERMDAKRGNTKKGK